MTDVKKEHEPRFDAFILHQIMMLKTALDDASLEEYEDLIKRVSQDPDLSFAVIELVGYFSDFIPRKQNA